MSSTKKQPTGSPRTKLGRPAAIEYSPEIAESICDRIAAGESMRAICRTEGWPDRTAVLRWLDQHPDFAAKCGRARELQADAFLEDMADICERVQIETLGSDQARVVLSSLQWRASKLAPKKYGDASRVELDAGSNLISLLAKLAD
jgi:hypothetical protein